MENDGLPNVLLIYKVMSTGMDDVTLNIYSQASPPARTAVQEMKSGKSCEDLRIRLKEHGASTRGTKSDLAARLSFYESGFLSSEDVMQEFSLKQLMCRPKKNCSEGKKYSKEILSAEFHKKLCLRMTPLHRMEVAMDSRAISRGHLSC